MPRPYGPSPESIRRIYDVLLKGPKSFENIWKETKLHRNTVGYTLGVLVKRRFLNRKMEGHRAIYTMEKPEPISIGWDIPWIDLMTTKEEKDTHFRIVEQKVEQDVRKFQFQLELEKRIELRNDKIHKRLVNHPQNRKLVEVAQKVGLVITPRILLKNLTTPYCLKCAKEKKRLDDPIFDNDSKELICSNCGLILGKEDFVLAPPLNVVEMEKRTRKLKKSPYYERIEELLKKYGA